MTTTATAREFLGTGEVCRRTGALQWHLEQAISRGLIAAPERIAGRRAWPIDRLEEVRQALVQAGYIADGVAGN